MVVGGKSSHYFISFPHVYFQVKVKLPATKLEDVTLDVKSKFLDCRTPK